MVETTHQLHFTDSRDLGVLEDESVDLAVTSPPYPMIAMWDEQFGGLQPGIGGALREEDGDLAFELMHQELDRTWSEVARVLKPGGFACINIGDATRTLEKRFRLYPNHARVVNGFTRLGLDALPAILWRKQTNAPNQFMGSGMLPAGAYVTLEHEYILVFRKGAKRSFQEPAAKQLRHRSAFFWEERNRWFSDLWFDLKGIPQSLNHRELRTRSAAYPLDLPYRLISMYSVQGDVVLDPFLGTGTSTLAAMAACRSSIGFEIDAAFRGRILKDARDRVPLLNHRISQRFVEHLAFVEERTASKGVPGYRNRNYEFPVMTRQEQDILLPYIESIEEFDPDALRVRHSEAPEIRRGEPAMAS